MPQAQPQPDKDSTSVDSKHYSVELENDRVRIVRARYGPHEKSVMHTHPATVAIFLNEGKVRMTYPDGRTEERNMGAGQTAFSEPEEHLPENLTDRPMEVVLIELKR
jgi:quercetin dioxygenase-like cupin family protein